MITHARRLAALKFLVQGATLHLYVNDHEPDQYDTLADYKEATFPGYAPIPLGAWEVGEWTDKTTMLTHPMLSHPLCMFVLADDLDVPETVYGWYVACGSELVNPEKCDPCDLAIARSKIKVTPILRGNNP